MRNAKSRIRSTKGKPARFSEKLSDSLNDIAAVVREHQQMIDSIQDVALELATAIGTLHTLTVKYAGTANKVLDGVLPIVQNLPIVPKNVRDLLVNLERWTQRIMDNNVKTAAAITDVQIGLETGDVSRLRQQAAQLQNVTKNTYRFVASKLARLVAIFEDQPDWRSNEAMRFANAIFEIALVGEVH